MNESNESDKMKQIFVFIVLCILQVYSDSGDEEYIPDYREAIELGLVEPEPYDYYAFAEEPTCVKAGRMCNGCSTVIQCIDLGNGEFMNATAEECDSTNGLYCLNGQCTKNNPLCSPAAKFDFKCTAVGMFPDPFDAQKYHVCYKDGDDIKDSDNSCDANHSYEPISTYCKTPFKPGGIISLPVPMCTKDSQTGAIKNRSIFYICTIVEKDGQKFYYPVLYLCPNGKQYLNYKCV